MQTLFFKVLETIDLTRSLHSPMVNLENKVIKARKLPDVKQKVGRVLSGASDSKPSQSRERRNSRPAASFLGAGSYL